MMSHFEKLRTPLFSVHKYPSLRQQEERFTEAGWSHASAKSLWTLWSDSQFLSDVQRMDLDKIETFDEWEEFALFASHYFLLVATTKIPDTDINIHDAREYTCSSIQTRSLTLEPRYPLKFSAQRRFGSLVPLRGGRVGLHGGWGLQTRLSSTQVFSDSAVKEPITDPLPTGIAARMCHSTTILGNDCLLSGGRASPAMPFGDCWLGSQGKWEQVDSLPIPCFRHSTVPLDLDSSKAVLLFGGKSGNGDVLGKFFIWTEKKGWNEVPVVGTIPESRFGALMISIDDHTGILCGGMSQAGLILNDFWFWSVLQSSDGPLHVSCMRLSENTPAAASLRWLSRFGSTANLLGDNIVIMGGVNVDGCIPQPLEVLTLNINILRLLMQGPQEHLASSLVPGNVQIDPETARPLLIGHSSIAIDNDKILVIGGGAVCFSFGTFWNKGTFLLRDGVPGARNEWFPVESAANFEHRSTEITTPKEQRVLTNTISVVTVPRVKITNSQDFRTIVDKSRPVILEGLNIGRCVEVWTKEYLQAAVGHGRKVCAAE